jgi:hypothetical protein
MLSLDPWRRRRRRRRRKRFHKIEFNSPGGGGGGGGGNCGLVPLSYGAGVVVAGVVVAVVLVHRRECWSDRHALLLLPVRH